MNEPENDALCARITRLERSSKAAWMFSALLAIALLAGLARPSGSVEELRAQRLVIEDDQGRPRVVIAAPLTELAGQVRSDEAVGVLLLDERGVDRVILGSPTTHPQIRGKLAKRIGPAYGINFNDTEGNERGGLGVLDNDGRAVLGLDTDSGEGVALFVTPTFTGLLVNGGGEGGHGQRCFLGTIPADRTTVLNFDDYDGKRRFQITMDEKPRLEFYNDDFEAIVTIPELDTDSP